METIKKSGQVIEFDVRKSKSDDAFGAAHAAFFESLNKYQGFQCSREFAYYAMNEQGIPTLQDNTQAVVIVWDNVESFQAAVESIMSSPEAAAFMPLIEPSAYFASVVTE